MTIALVDVVTATFNDGSTGHIVTHPAGAPRVGEWDIIGVNSDTVVATPSGWDSIPSHVSNQGAYVFSRQAAGGEAATVTITTTGNFNTSLTWSRWRNAAGNDATIETHVDLTAGTSTPAISTGPLATGGQLVVAYGALHGWSGTAAPTSPVWSSGYTALVASPQIGSAGSGAASFTGYRVDGGPGAETPQVSWTNTVQDAYMLVFTLIPEVVLVAVPGSIPGPAGAPATFQLAAAGVDFRAGSVLPAGSPATLIASAGPPVTQDAIAGSTMPASGGRVAFVLGSVPAPAVSAEVILQTVTAVPIIR